MKKDSRRQCCDLLVVRGSLGSLMANCELVDTLEGTAAWDLTHPASALTMIPTASPRTGAGGGRAAGWLQGTRQPTPPGDSCPSNVACPPASASPQRSKDSGSGISQ